MDINRPRMRVVAPSAKCEKCRIVSTCKECGGKSIIAYEVESRYIKEQAPFDCKHNKIITSLNPEQGEEMQMIDTPQPRMARLGSAL